MGWIDVALFNVTPVLIVMSILAVLAPPLRRLGAWRGIGLAWLATFLLTLVVALTNLGGWSLDCSWLGSVRTGVTGVTALGVGPPCTGSNGFPSWLVALPAVVGIGILLAVLARRAPSGSAAVRATVGLTVLSAVVIALGQVSEGVALFVFFAALGAIYAWPRLRPGAAG